MCEINYFSSKYLKLKPHCVVLDLLGLHFVSLIGCEVLQRLVRVFWIYFVLITSTLQEFHEKPVEERKEAMQAGKREERLADTPRV